MPAAPARDVDRYTGESTSGFNYNDPTYQAGIEYRRAAYQAAQERKRRKKKTSDGFRYVPPPLSDDPRKAYMQAVLRAEIEKRRLRVMERYRSNMFRAEQADFGKSMAGKLRDEAIARIAKENKLSAKQAAERYETVRQMTSDTKRTYRERGLYFGTMSGDYDPLLKNAYNVQYAESPDEQQRAIDAYSYAMQYSGAHRGLQRQSLAKQTQDQLRRDLAQFKIVKGYAKSLSGEMKAYIEQLEHLTKDPKAYLRNPEGVISGAQTFQSLVDQAKKMESEANKGGLAGIVQDVTSAPVLGTALRAAAVPMEEIVMDPYYASQRGLRESADKEGDTPFWSWRSANSAVSSLPGLGFLAGGASARDRRATNTPEKRAALTEAGKLESFGQRVTGDDKWYTSGLVDAAFQVVGDPLNAVTLGTAKLAKIGQLSDQAALSAFAKETGTGFIRASFSSPARLRALAERQARKGLKGAEADAAAAAAEEGVRRATQTARANFIEGTRRGRNLQRAAERAIEEGLDAKTIQRTIPGIDQRAAAEIAAAGSKKEALDAFKRAFVSGEYNPSVTVRRQILGSFETKGGRSSRVVFNLPGGVGFGPRVIRSQEGLWDVVGRARRAARPDQIRATARVAEGHYAEAVANTLQAGLARAGTRVDDAYEAVGAKVIGLAPEERLGQVYETLAGTPGLEDLFERSFKATQKQVHKLLNAGDKTLGLARTGKEALADWGRLVDSAEFEAWLKQMELIAAMAKGEFGDAAAKQVATEATFGLKRLPTSESTLLNTALKNTGVTLPATGGLGLSAKEGATYLRARIETYVTDPEVQRALLDEVSRVAKGKKPKVGLGRLERKVEALLDDAVETGSEFQRLLRNEASLSTAVEPGLDSVGAMRRLMNQPLKLVNAITEPISPAKVAFLGFENEPLAVARRVEAFDRYFMALDFDDFTRQTLRQRVERITNEKEMYDLTNEALLLKAAREGIDPVHAQALSRILQAGQQQVKSKQATLVTRIEDGTFKAADEVYTLAQKGEVVYLPDPDDVRRTIREIKALQGNIPARIRRGIGAIPDLSLFGLHGPVTGDLLTIRNVLMKVHRKWKYVTVVPGLELAAFGAVVGYASADGDTEDRLKQAAAGASLGLLTPLRYVMRVAGIEEGMRKYLTQGYTPEAWLPHIGKFRTQFGLDLPFRPVNAVKAGDPVATQGQRLLETVHDGWDVLEPTKNPVKKLFRKDSRYLDGYGRIINNQAHPESDAIADLFLRRQAGEMTADEVAAEFRRFIKTDSGKVWMARHRAAFHGAISPEEAFARHDEWYRTYFPDPEVARARLDAARSYTVDGVKRDVPTDILKAAQRRNALPEAIHAPNTFRIPRNFREVALVRDRLTSRFAFEGPTTMLNRAPLAKSLYRDRYNDLLGAGVPRRRAQEIAEQQAVDETNRIMFRIDDESRFAAKVDFVFPFQQPREEMLRVWLPLMTRNKARTLHMARLAGVAFNNGKESGMFQQDAYGEWRMAVPGGAFLSKVLFNSSAAFDFRLQDLVFFGQGAYGINIVPSPGGPYFGTLARLAINRWPDNYENMPPFVKEWMFPYGSTGRLFRPEVSRMWQAWLNEPAPFEFASRAEQEDALEKHRRFIFLQLKWQHAQKTGDWSWEPTESELDEAVSASLKAWAFIGAVAPATPGLIRPDQRALDVVKAQFIAENGSFDYFKFIERYPMWEPWLIAGTEMVDDSFEKWAESVKESEYPWERGYDADETTTHQRRQKKFSEWHKELKERERESAAYRERGDIQFAPAHIQQKLYAAWDEKYPDLAMRSHDNYNRDVELMHIEGTLIGASKDRALDAWRKRYNVSPANYARLKKGIESQTLRTKFDPWDMARPQDVVFDDVQKQLRGTQYGRDFLSRFDAELRTTRDLPVAEQVMYWNERLLRMDYEGTPEETLDQYKAIKRHISTLWKTAPMQLSRKMASEDYKPLAQLKADQKAEDYRVQIAEAYAQAYEIDAQVKALQAKGIYYGSTIKALKDKRKALFDLARELKNDWYEGIPDTTGMFDDVRAVAILTLRGRPDLVKEIRKYREEWGFFLPSGEQDFYLDMNSDVRQAYVDDLVNGLNIAPDTFQKGKMFWEWLTEFQQDLLERNLPKDMVERWKREHPMESGSGRGYGRGGGRGYYGRGGGGSDELGFAYAMFRQYNKRGGMKAPPAYKEYLELPNDAALRTAFLRQHPEVANYIKAGPMANMPPSLAMLVADIMIRNGKWEGESRSMTEISEIGFAREMMARWNRRGNRSAPAAYQLWLDMPTGPAKAEYLKKHPEIGEWVQLGPMVNMPEPYREVVRDIMFRYGMWSDSQDPLGKTISGYYSTPSYLKDKYLEEHPELAEYWKLTRSPEQKRYYELADTYFAMTDANSKRAFLHMHPELQEFFLNQRQKRYENFLNQVAVYMGSNPELFTKYLERQEDILTELLHKFSEMPMIRERFIMRDRSAQDRRAAA